ncbi:MAG: hypothetical protein ACC656_14385, partial [Candidatus Heimdallarchaeota archaeon]
DNNDPLKTGRLKVNVPRFFDGLEIEDLPWAAPRYNHDGEEFILPDVGKVVVVYFSSGDIYHPEYYYSQNTNINLQAKLESLTTEAYFQFKAMTFDANFQFYKEPDIEGMVLDYVKSKFQITPNGDMILNLRDNASTLYLGSKEADQSVILGDRFINWFDKFMRNMIGQFGGPFLGNLSAPVIANPAFLQVSNEYFAIRQQISKHFLSDRVKVVDNDAVVANQREFDVIPESDEVLYLDEEKTVQRQRIYQPSNAPTSAVRLSKLTSSIDKIQGATAAAQDIAAQAESAVADAQSKVKSTIDKAKSAVDKAQAALSDVTAKAEAAVSKVIDKLESTIDKAESAVDKAVTKVINKPLQK